MPVNVDLLTERLTESGYDATEIEFLQDGLKNSFDIGYQGLTERQSTAENIPFTVGNSTKLWNKVMKEVKLG